jgi:hypothetical protein
MVTVKLDDLAATGGTYFQGYLPDGTTYKDLVKMFGEPNSVPKQWDGDGKTTAEWCGVVDDPDNGVEDEVFTVYDWKGGSFWHVGAHRKQAALALFDWWLEKTKRV